MKALLLTPNLFDTYDEFLLIEWLEPIENEGLSYSIDLFNGKDWICIAKDLTGTSQFVYKLNGMPNGTEYLVKIKTIKDGTEIGYDVSDEAFSILEAPAKRFDLAFSDKWTVFDLRVSILMDEEIEGASIIASSGEKAIETAVLNKTPVDCSLWPNGTYLLTVKGTKDGKKTESNPIPVKIQHAGTIYIDKTPPKAKVSIISKPTSKKALFSISGSDEGTDVSKMRYNLDGIWTEWEPFKILEELDLSKADGNVEVKFQFKDYAGNETLESIYRVSEIENAKGLSDCLMVQDESGIYLAKGKQLFVLKGTIRSLDSLPAGEATALAIVDGFLVVAAYDVHTGMSTVYRYDGGLSEISKIGTKISFLQDRNGMIYATDDRRVYCFEKSFSHVICQTKQEIVGLKKSGANLIVATKANEMIILDDDLGFRKVDPSVDSQRISN